MQILVISKERTVKNILAEILGFEGHDVTSADDIPIGVEKSLTDLFDAVVYRIGNDCSNPLMDLELLKGMRGKPKIILIPTIRINEDECKQKGAYAIIDWPMNLNSILATIKSIPEREKYTYDYPRPAMTADCVLFSYDENDELSVLLIERKNKPYKNFWAFPGGFLERNETVEECAVRELKEETGLVISDSTGNLRQLGCYSTVDRDPRGRVITIAFYALIQKEDVNGSDDASDARWFPVSSLPPLAFDHEQILRDALTALFPAH